MTGTALGFVVGAVLGAFITFRAAAWLVSRLPDAERVAFAKKVTHYAKRRDRL